MMRPGLRHILIRIWLTMASPAFAAGPTGQNDPSPALPVGDANATPMTDIHDIKPALAVSPDLRWLYWTLAVAALSILAVIAWRLWQKRTKPATPGLAAAPVSAATEAYRQLDALAAEGNLAPGQFYFQLSAILRRYIERRYKIPAAEMTTEELLPMVARLPLQPELNRPLKAFCRGADPIKFAGAFADQHRMANDLAFARDFVRLTPEEPEATLEDAIEATPSRPVNGTVSKQLPLNGDNA